VKGRLRAFFTIVAVSGTAALVGCGDAKSSGSPASLNVSAASSLKKPIDQLATSWKQSDLKLEFAGSDKIAAALETGRKPDVVVLAGNEVPGQLYSKGLISVPQPIAANRLVVATRKSGVKVGSITDLARPGIKLALGTASVPVGKYADRVLANLPEATRKAILANVKTREPDAAGVTGKLTSGAVDAAIIYRTDVLAANGMLVSAVIPSSFKPTVKYFASSVEGSSHQSQASALLESLKSGKGQAILVKNGFLPASAD